MDLESPLLNGVGLSKRVYFYHLSMCIAYYMFVQLCSLLLVDNVGITKHSTGRLTHAQNEC